MKPNRAKNEFWPTSPAAAREVQERLRDAVVAEDRFGAIRHVAGLDVHYAPKTELTWGAAAVVARPHLELQESALACRPTRMPYVPGFLSFREAPAMLAALDVLSAKPDLLLIDGQGLAHPRRLGLACHVGVLADIPTIGVAKSRLTGVYEEPGLERGSRSPLLHHGEMVGAVLRTRRAVRPVFVSTGHRVGLQSAIELVLELTPRYRLAEPIRLADRLSRIHP